MVFISCAKPDQEIANDLRDFLVRSGFRTWTGAYDAPPSNDYEAVIINSIKKSSTLVVLLSKASAKSEWIKSEVLYATAKGKQIIAIYLEDCVLNCELEFLLENARIFDCKNGFEESLDLLANSIGEFEKNQAICSDFQLFSSEWEIKYASLVIEILKDAVRKKNISLLRIEREFSISFTLANAVIECLKAKKFIYESPNGETKTLLLNEGDFKRIFK